MGALYDIAGRVYYFTGDLRHYFLLMAAIVIVSPVATLLHECGHGIALKSLTGGRVDMVIGDPSRGLRLEIPRAGVRLSLSLRSGGAGVPLGFVRVNWFSATLRQAAIITLAGPLASFVGLLVVLVLLAHAAIGSVVYFLLVAGALCCLLGTLNLIPAEWDDPKGGRRHRSDGALLRLFMRLARSGVNAHTPLAVLEERSKRRQPQVSGSIPPPSRPVDGRSDLDPATKLTTSR